MEMDVDRVDINILYFLYTNNKVSTFYSSQISEIQDYFSAGNHKLAYYTIVRRIQKLIEKKYVAEGFKNRNAKTYFILQKGIDFIDNLDDDIVYVDANMENNNQNITK